MVRLPVFAAFVALVSLPLSAVPVASLSSLEGDVSVLRSGIVIPSEKVSEGFLLEPFDTVSTGTTGRADLKWAPSIGLAGTLRLDFETTLYLDVTALKKEQTAGIELLAGSVSVRLTAVSGASSLEVRTGVGTFAGVGPSFRVVETPGGDALVTVDAGRVVCRVEERTVLAEPGAVVQVSFLDRSVQTIPMNVSTLEAFAGTWALQRRQAFRDQSAVAFRVLAARYQLQVGHFQRAWDRIQREAKDDDKAVRAATANLRRAAGPLERSLYQIRALRKLMEEGVLSPSVELGRGYSARDFFRQAAAEEALWTTRLGEARGFYRALADRSGGEFPRAADGAVITWDSDYFH